MTGFIKCTGLLTLFLLSGLLTGCAESGDSNADRPIEEIEAELAPPDDGGK